MSTAVLDKAGEQHWGARTLNEMDDPSAATVGV